MTRKEVSEIFSVMMLAWPGAEMFKGGIEKLGPTIQLWTTCLEGVDCWTAQQATVVLCKECKFPPTIADFQEKVDKVNAGIKAQISDSIQQIRSAEFMHGSLEEFYKKLPDNSRTKIVITAMGGPQHLVKTSKFGDQETSMWDWTGFENTYKKLLRQKSALDNTPKRAALGVGTKEKK